jgi:hypothetical protein
MHSRSASRADLVARRLTRAKRKSQNNRKNKGRNFEKHFHNFIFSLFTLTFNTLRQLNGITVLFDAFGSYHVGAGIQYIFYNHSSQRSTALNPCSVYNRHTVKHKLLGNGFVGLYGNNSAARNGNRSGNSSARRGTLGVCVFLSALAGMTAHGNHPFALIKLNGYLTALGANYTC